MSDDYASGLTPSQTVGPYFAIGLDWKEAWRLFPDQAGHDRIEIQGQVLDGDGVPVTDALLEIWQVDAAGHYQSNAGDTDGRVPGLGRCATDASGRFWFNTIKPGVVVEERGSGAPHIHVCVFARGLLVHLYTRIYFGDEPDTNADDLVLQCVPAERRHTLIADRNGDRYTFDVRLQGVGETVFFDV